MFKFIGSFFGMLNNLAASGELMTAQVRADATKEFITSTQMDEDSKLTPEQATQAMELLKQFRKNK